MELMTKFIKLSLLSFVLYTSCVYADASQYALLDEVRIEDVSKKGVAIVIDRGHLEHYKNGDYAKLYVQSGPKEQPTIFLVAEAELVKIFPKNSYWAIRKLHLNGIIAKDRPMLLMSDTRVASGRRNVVANKQVVFSEHNYQGVEDFNAKNENMVPSRLIKNKDDYSSIEQLEKEEFNPELNKDRTAIVSTHEYYKESPTVVAQTQYGQTVPKKYFLGTKEVKLGDISSAEDRILLSSMGANYEEKVKSLKYGVDSFYRDAQAIEVENTKTMESIYEEDKLAEKEAKNISPKALAKIKKEGPQWSAGMSDEHLRRYLVTNGIEQEVQRRKKALNEQDGNEVIFHFTNGLMNHATEDDPNYHSPSYSFGVSYDYHFSRVDEKYKKWTFQVIFEKALSNFDAGGTNVKSDETIYGAYVNYYLWNNPLTLYNLSWLVGAGIKNGSALASAESLEDNYKYQVLSPSLQTMVKYRFRAGKYSEETVNVGMSFNVGAMLDMRTLSVQNELNDNIDSKISYVDLKYIVGLSIFF